MTFVRFTPLSTAEMLSQCSIFVSANYFISFPNGFPDWQRGVHINDLFLW
jgi:hypothetical protein